MSLRPAQPQKAQFETIILTLSRWLLVVTRGGVKPLQVDSAPLLLLDQFQAGFQLLDPSGEHGQ